VSFTLRRTLTPTELLRKRALRLMTARNQEVGDLEEKLGMFVSAMFPKRTLATITDTEAESAIRHLDGLITKEAK
jgi:hypothetical protein